MGENTCKPYDRPRIHLQNILCKELLQLSAPPKIIIENGHQVYEKMLKSIVIREMQIETTMRYHLIPVRMTIIKKMTGVAKDVEKLEPSHTVVRNVK